MVKGVSVKVKFLRKRGYDNLKEWMSNPNNVLITRHGRIFIDKKIFHYPASKWANPFSVKEYGLKKCLEMYEEYLCELVRNNREEFLALADAGELGCFCDEGEPCHRDILIKWLRIASDLIKSG